MKKRIDGTYVVSQVVPDSKRKTLWITSARIEKADVGSQVPNADISLQHTSETPLVSSSAFNNSITEQAGNVNLGGGLGLSNKIESIEAKATEAAFEAGRQNVPREKVNLVTPAQEEAYNAGRLEHIKNMPAVVSERRTPNTVVDKQKQLDVVLNSNPATDDYHTQIRKVEDIKTFEEAIQDYDYTNGDDVTPDFTSEMIKRAFETGKITVYSSKPIENGSFVTPSKMEAQSYAGSGNIYSAEVNLTDVAWVNELQGQYANIGSLIEVSTEGLSGIISDNILEEGVSEYNFVIRPIKMKVFPPYNQSKSDANERATRWAHKENVKTGAQKLVSYHNRWYIIEKFDSAELGYQIVGSVTKKQVDNFTNEVKKRENEIKQRRQRVLDGLTGSIESGNTNGLRGSGIDNDANQYGGETGTVQDVAEDQTQGRKVSNDADRSDEHDRTDRKNNNNGIEQSSDDTENNVIPAEVEKYDIPEDSEIVSNIVVDEYSKRLKRENPRAYSNIVRMAKRLGMTVRFVKDLMDENGKVLEGLITSKGIFINADAKNPSRFVATHEFGHRMKQAAPEVWAAYQEYVINKLKRESFGSGRTAYDVLYEETKNAYGKDDTAYINEEIAVNYAGELFDSEEMLESFIREDKSLALRVRDWWYNVLESMGLLSEKKKAQQLWLRAYTAAAKNVKEGKVGEYNEKRASQMRNAQGETQSEETDEQRRKKGFQKNSLIKKIQSNLEQLSKEDVILSLNTDIFNDRNMNIVEQVGNFFNSLGNEVYRAGFGEVILDKDGIKSAIGHKLGRAKCIAFRAVPDIIKYGKQIDYQEKWKGKPYDSYVFAGKVKIGKEDAFVGVVVTRNKNTSEYYLHEIVDNEGNFISIKNDEVVPNKTVSKTDNSLHGGTTSPIDTISQDDHSGNSHSMKNTEENAQEGKKSIAGTRLSELVEKYGTIPSGEKPHRNVQVPRKTSQDKKVSQTVRTILEAKATPDEAVPTIEKLVEDGTFSYDVYTDKQAINDAESYIKEYGWDESLNDWFHAVEKGEVSKQVTTMGWALYNNAANLVATATSETERSSAIKTSLNILDAMVRHQRSAAQALQATRILKKLSPETQLYGIQKSVRAFQNELIKKYGKRAPNLKIDEGLAGQFLNAKTEEERHDTEIEIFRDIGRQIPAFFSDKWNGWRYLGMLFNLRTHGRNIGGNAGFAPIVLTKNLTATAIESAVYHLGGKKMLRGKALVWGSKSDRVLLKAAWNDYANVAELISNDGKYNDFAMANRHIEEGRQIFKFRPLEWSRKKNSDLLEKEDMWFSKPHYAYALAQYCKANNITAEQIKRGKAIAPARNYAIKEAQKATYRDTNAFSQMVSEWGRSNKNEKNVVKKAFNTAIEGILPFRKTPANILVRGIEYSPLGLLKSLSYDLVQVSKGEMMATEAIDNISAGLTGTGLLALGVYLAAQGLVRGHGEDDEEKEFKELMGHQSYSLELPNGQSITLDWLAPEALPLFVGVNIWEATKGFDEEVNFSTILKVVSNITEPMLEMSCLQSLNDLFEGIGYATSKGTSGLMAVLSSAATSYLTQAIPTFWGQVERTGEKNRMTTYTEKNDFLTGDMQYTLGKISSKIPFWDYQQIPYIDAWGRKEASGNALKRGFNNFLNPAYTSTIETSKMEEELLRLYDKTGESGVFPSRAGKYFTVDGVRKDLTADEYVRYATLKGEKSYKLVSELVKSKTYKKLSDEEKVKAVNEAYDYANQKAKKAISNYKPDSWVDKADDFGKDAENYISFRAEVSGAKEDNDGKISKSEVVDIILDMAKNDSETWKMYLSMYDSKAAVEAEKYGIDAELFMTAVVDMSGIKPDYKNGKAINGSRRKKIERYLYSVCDSHKEYLFLLGSEYESVKDDYDYVKYFGN